MMHLYKKIVKEFPAAFRRRLPKKVEIIEVSERKSQTLNRRYRKKNKATNVLSFRYGPEYGEIIVCPAVIRREAKKQGHEYWYQFAWMIAHGLLHLAGMHHERSAAVAKKIKQAEDMVLWSMFGGKTSKFKMQSSK